MRPAAAETFPADGYMLEDKTYENAATYTNTGVYEGSVNATAEYTDNIYDIAAGTYLPAGAEVAETCEAGSFCPGKTDATYDESAPQGITACPTGYPNSAAGAGAETQCYTACTLATANIAHATGVSGNDYFGDGADTCAATDCDPGYHVNEDIKLVEKTPVIPFDYTVAGDGYAYINYNGESGGNIADTGLTENNTWASHFDYGTIYGRASCQNNTNSGNAYEYFRKNMVSARDNKMTFGEFESGLAAIVGAAKAAYVTNALRDYTTAFRSGDETEKASAEKSLYVAARVLLATEIDANYTTDSTGGHCFCQITGYTLTDGNFESVTSAPWVLDTGTNYASCKASCASFCGSEMRYNYAYSHGLRAAAFGAIETLEPGATCDANEITINWSDADQADIDANNAGICTYGEDIRTPVKAVTKKGKTFKGWKFEKAN